MNWYKAFVGSYIGCCQDCHIGDPHFIYEETETKRVCPCPSSLCVPFSLLDMSQFRDSVGEDEEAGLFALCDTSPGILTHYPEPWKV